MRNLSATLTARQLRWIDEYLIDFNGAAAAVRAGYSRKCARSIAYENTTKPDIQAVLQERQAAIAKKMQITRQGVIQGLLEAVEIGRELRTPIAMISALREVGRMVGFYAPEVKPVKFTAGQGGVQANLAAMNDVQLLALIAQGAEAA